MAGPCVASAFPAQPLSTGLAVGCALLRFPPPTLSEKRRSVISFTLSACQRVLCNVLENLEKGLELGRLRTSVG